MRKGLSKLVWKVGVALLLASAVALWLTWGFWTRKVGESLTCVEQGRQPADALLLENFDPDYFVFQRAALLQKEGSTARILVPILTRSGAESDDPFTEVLKGTAELMARVSGLHNIEVLTVEEHEPISLNAANQIREFLVKERLRSVVVVSPGFRSRRSFFVYDSVFRPAGIDVGCIPAFGPKGVQNWSQSWHGMQEVGLQFAKLQYYRFYVLW